MVNRSYASVFELKNGSGRPLNPERLRLKSPYSLDRYVAVFRFVEKYTKRHGHGPRGSEVKEALKFNLFPYLSDLVVAGYLKSQGLDD